MATGTWIYGCKTNINDFVLALILGNDYWLKRCNTIFFKKSDSAVFQQFETIWLLFHVQRRINLILVSCWKTIWSVGTLNLTLTERAHTVSYIYKFPSQFLHYAETCYRNTSIIWLKYHFHRIITKYDISPTIQHSTTGVTSEARTGYPIPF